MNTIRVVLMIVDPVLLEKFHNVLDQQDDIEIVGETASGEAGLQMAQELKPDLILVDFELAHPSRFDLVRQLNQNASQVKVLVLQSRKDQPSLRGLLLSGTVGAIEKEESPERILSAVRQTATNQLSFHFKSVTDNLAFRSNLPGVDLSPHELAVLRLVVEGKTDQNVGFLLGMSEQTVTKYKYAIYCKLMLQNGL